MGRTKGRDTKIHVAVEAQGLPVTVAMTEGRTADCEAACPLMEGMDAKALSAGGACDPHAIFAHGEAPDRGALIPSRRSRKARRAHDKAPYRLEHGVENAFGT